MSNHITKLIRKYREVLLDTNILLLYFVGSVDPQLILEHKRTYNTFTVEDHTALINLLRHFNKIITTPNILTEVSNLLGQSKEHLRSGYFEKFAAGIAMFDEHCLDSADVSKMQEFIRFGLTDAAMVRLAKDNYLIITEDFRLSQYAQSLGIDVLNFNNIRPYFWE